MIDLNDLRHSISTALNLGRYTLVVKQIGGEPVPASITLDLVERDDDDFEAEIPPCFTITTFDMGDLRDVPVEFSGTVSRERAEEMSRRAMANALRPTITPEGDALRDTVTDDHGPAVPAQRDESSAGVRGGAMDRSYAEWHREITEAVSARVYGFAAQDTKGAWALSTVLLADAPDQEAAALADWVHVYDRVTRERRTLKRPEPDAVLTGLRDVAADLRRQAFEGSDPSKPYDGSGMVKGMADMSPLIVTRGGVPVEDQKAGLEEFKAACLKPDPMPPVGPLTSTERLKVGDIVRCEKYWKCACRVSRLGDGKVWCSSPEHGEGLWNVPSDGLSFVARPGVWMPWKGGENPVPGMRVNLDWLSLGVGGPMRADIVEWDDKDIKSFMVVDTPPSKSDT